jgi:hypothetical protein
MSKFEHSVLNSAQDFVNDPDYSTSATIEQLLEMHKYNYQYSKIGNDELFEILLQEVTNYKLLIASIDGHIKRKETPFARQKIKDAKAATKAIIDSAQKFLEKIN